VQHKLKDRIAQLAAHEDPDCKPGTEEYLASYQGNCSNVLKGLTEEEAAECKKLAEEWNSTGPDGVTKARCVEM
jgi:hypothetical protein